MKWYVIAGILVVLLAITLTSCVPVPIGRPELEDEVARLEGELVNTKAELSDVQSELRTKESELSDVQSELRTELEARENELADVSLELEAVRSHLARLKATKEIDFGNGLRVFDLDAGDYWVEGKVENVSGVAMDEVVIFVAFYDWDGSFGGVVRDSVSDLFPGEVMEWRATVSFYGSWHGEPGLCDVYAIGGKR